MQNIKVNIKRVDSMDIGPLYEMALAFSKEENLEYPEITPEHVNDHMLHVLATKDNPNFIYLIAYAGKKPVGFGFSYIGTHEWGSPSRVLVGQELYVVPEKRTGSIALKIMEKTFDIACNLPDPPQGFECVGTYGKTDKMWEKFGFKPHLVYGHMPLDKVHQIISRVRRNATNESL